MKVLNGKNSLYLCKMQIYPMCRAKRGIFLLIDNQNFYAARAAGIKLADRDGTEFDQTALHSLFEALDFKVEIKDNCSAKVTMFSFN